MRIIQLSDSHLLSDKPKRAAELEACIQHINAMQPAPDVVVHTGDIAHNGEIEDYRVARRLLDKLSAPYFVLAGNRDNHSNLIEVFADDHHLRADATFVQYAVDDFDVRLIMIDTVSAGDRKGHLCETRFQHIKDMLVADRSRPAVLFLHHPPFEVTVGPDRWHFKEKPVVEALIAEFDKHEHVHSLCCGHVHRSFETRIGPLPANVVSSVVSDVRWDKPHGENSDLPVFKIYDVPSEGV